MSDKTVLDMTDGEICDTYYFIMQEKTTEIDSYSPDKSRGPDGFFKRATILQEKRVCYSVTSAIHKGW